jgi:hypothetical protein
MAIETAPGGLVIVAPYDRRVLSPFLLAAALVVGLFALAPTRRLFVAGWSPAAVATYFFGLWLLGLLLAIAPRAGRLVLPLIVVVYAVPFINWRAGVERLVGWRPREARPPMKDVTPKPHDESRETR